LGSSGLDTFIGPQGFLKTKCEPKIGVPVVLLMKYVTQNAIIVCGLKKKMIKIGLVILT